MPALPEDVAVLQSLASANDFLTAHAATPTWPVLVEVVTTTLTEASSSSSVPVASSAPADSIPIGAIAGGASGGVLIAVVAVVGWMWWGRKLKKAHEKRRRAARATLATKANTRRNASSLSTPRTFNYMPSFTERSSEKKVKFVSNTSSNLTIQRTTTDPSPSLRPPPANLDSTPLHPSLSSSHTPAGGDSAARTPIRPPRRTLSKPPPVNRRASTASNRQVDTSARRFPNMPSHSSPLAQFPARLLRHKSSTVSSGSMYSTQSAEEHQNRVPATLILAALGHAYDGRRLSNIARNSIHSMTDEPAPPSSFRYPFRPGARDGVNAVTQHSRLSQVSTGSASLQLEESEAPVGIAYGGEEDGEEDDGLLGSR